MLDAPVGLKDWFPTWINESHGTPVRFWDYGTVVTLTTDDGIATQIAHMRELLRSLMDRQVRTRRIAL